MTLSIYERLDALEARADLVRIGDLRQILAQMLHSDPEAILQAKDTARAMTVLEVVEEDMARVSRAANSPELNQPNLDDFKQRWVDGMQRQRALMVECELWKRRVATGINLLRGWLQQHEGTSSIKPVNATRSYIGEPAPEGWMADPPNDEMQSSKQAVCDLKADLAKADSDLIDALILLSDWTADRRREDLERDTKLFLAKHINQERS